MLNFNETAIRSLDGVRCEFCWLVVQDGPTQPIRVLCATEAVAAQFIGAERTMRAVKVAVLHIETPV